LAQVTAPPGIAASFPPAAAAMECVGASEGLCLVHGARRPLQARRTAVHRRASTAPLFGLLALAAAASAALAAVAFVPVGGSVWKPAQSVRGDAIVRRVSQYYSNKDRERLKQMRKEMRIELRERSGPTTPTLDWDKLPAIEDIYNRKYSGNATADPIGGRKRYSYYVMFKMSPKLTSSSLSEKIMSYIWFLKNKMSCRDIKAQPMKSPIDGASTGTSTVTLEYPMKEYGEVPRDQKNKDRYQKARLVKFDFYAPVTAHEYIQKKIYSDNDILRFMVLGHTRTFKHVGEDNELHL